MEIKELDRDALRKNQRRINLNVIGNIIEYKPQHPRSYRNSGLINEKTTKESSNHSNGSSFNPDLSKNIKSVLSNSHLKSDTNDDVTSQKYALVSQPKPDEQSHSNNHDIVVKSNGSNLETKCNTKSKPDDLPISLEEVHKNSWLNMDRVEFDKMAWMFSPPEPPILEDTTCKFNRFGQVVNSNLVKMTNKQNLQTQDGIKSHDDSFDDECFDFSKLAILLDSGYQRQVSFGLTVISKIAELANCGYYDGMFSENIQSLLIKYYLLRVRHQMDNRDETTRFNAFKCMAAIICNTDADEIYLDRIHTLICDDYEDNLLLQPKELLTTQTEIDKLTDMQYAELDPIMCLISRTKILERFAFIMESKGVHRHDDYLECIIDVIIRFARHSIAVCSLMNQKSFLQIVLDSCLTGKEVKLEDNYIRTLCRKTLKFFRLITQSIVLSKRNIYSENIPCNIPESITVPIRNYFLINTRKLDSNDMNSLTPLALESMRIVKFLKELKEFQTHMLDLIVLAQSHLISQIRALPKLESAAQLGNRISLNWQLVAHLIDLICSIRGSNQLALFVEDELLHRYITPCFYTWLTHLINERFIPHLDVSISIATAFKHLNSINDGRNTLADLMTKVTIRNDTSFFKLLVRKAREESFLKNFSQINGRLRYPKFLQSYGIVNYNIEQEYKITFCTILDSYSPFILLDVFIQELSKKKVDELDFLNDDHLIRYLVEATTHDHLPITHEKDVKENLYAQREAKMLARILLLLNKYYLEHKNNSDGLIQAHETEDPREPENFIRIRKDCYANIYYNAIALLDLLNTRKELDPVCFDLKSKLLQQIVFNDKFQFRLTRENSVTTPRSQLNDLNSWQSMISKTRYGDKLLFEMNCFDNRRLFSLYETMPLYTRYWIMEPVRQYYLIQTRYQAGDSEKDDCWLRNNVEWSTPAGELITCSDAEVITAALNYHMFVLLYCRKYKHIIVRSNVEDFLCSIGTIFLHDDIFLDQNLNNAITNNVRMIMNDCLLNSMGKFQAPFKDASQMLQSIEIPLGDFFNQLLDQFEAVSYGDLAFSNFLLLFITPESDLSFRKKLFQEKADTCLPILKIQHDDLFCPKELFFNVIEKDLEMKMTLRRAQTFSRHNSFLLEYIKRHSS